MRVFACAGMCPYRSGVNRYSIGVVSFIALLVLGALPWIWPWSPILGLLCAVLISAWVIWSIWFYLTWARTLGRSDAPPRH